MKKSVRLIVDLNAVLNAALLGGKDPDGLSVQDENGKFIHINSALYGVERFFDYLVPDMERFNVAPVDVIGVWDGLRSKQFRQMHLAKYKVGREKHPAAHEQLGLAREQVNQMLRAVGVTTCVTPAREADDTIAYLVRELRDRPNFISTVDGDLSRLVDENTHVWRGGELNRNPYGGFPHRFITLYKALVGDTSDGIPGARGFGDAAWVDLVRIFGLDGLERLEDLIVSNQLDKLREDVGEFPKLQKIIDDKVGVAVSWRVASLHPDEINTRTHPIEWAPAMVKGYFEIPEELRVPAMRKWYATKTLVTSLNYDKALNRLKDQALVSPFVALDIETSSPDESDAWLEVYAKKGGKDRIDALGHELTGMSLTFGDNLQHTIYMSVDHAQTENITVDQCREAVEAVQHAGLVAHNRAFEFQVLYRTWGDKWKSNGWHGFLPNCLDTLIEASYVDENLPRGLKFRSKQVLGYEQETYEQVTTMEGPLDVILPGGLVKVGPFAKVVKEAVLDEDGAELEPAVTEEGWYVKQYKMNELTGQRVLNYGCDDTICTAWLHAHFQTIMKLEKTWDVYLQVEVLPQYLTSLAYVQGTPLNTTRLKELRAEDEAILATNWATMRDYLFTKGWAGTSKPEFTELTVAVVKQAIEIVLGEEFSTRKKKPPAVAIDIREAFPDNDDAEMIATAFEQGNISAIQRLVDLRFNGEPKINFDSPRQMQKLLYGTIGITPRIYNKLTAKERQDEAMSEAFAALRRINQGRKVEVQEGWRELWQKKASTDDQAIDLALAKDELSEEQRTALKAYLKIKEVSTRIKMFYNSYTNAPHWRDGLLHSSMNQCEAITRRYSSTGPNLQQLPSRGEGIKFRTLLPAHSKDAVMVSLDFSGQELVLMAEVSGDEALRSCYMGDNLKDGHSLIAVAAAPALWGEEITYEQFIAMRKSKDEAIRSKADALRGNAKTVNFATQFGAMAPKVALTLKSTEEVAQEFIDAKDKAFPGINIWKTEQAEINERRGYALTLLGARRHLTGGEGYDDSRLERQGINYEIQGSAAEQTKLAMSSMWKRGLFTGKYDARFIAPIHDETVSSVHRKDAVKFIREAHECMTQRYANMVVPMKSSLAIGRDFSCPIEIGTDFTDEQVQEAIDRLFAE